MFDLSLWKHHLSHRWQLVSILSVFLLSLSLVACGSSAEDVKPSIPKESTSKGPAYLMASLEVKDFDKFMATYGAKASPTVIGAGGQVLVASNSVTLKEGKYQPNWTVLIRFPSMSAAQDWYNSAEYQKAIPLRQAVTNKATSRLLFAPAFEPTPSNDAPKDAMYMFASLKVNDFDALMNQYGAAAQPTVIKAGGQVVVASPEVNLLEGSYAPNWTVVIRFPSKEAALDWYDSAEYQAAVPKRHAITDKNQSWLMFAPSFEPPMVE